MTEHGTSYWAHSHPDQPVVGDKWQPLAEHLRNVASLSRQFAENARPGDSAFAQAAYAAGLLHDLGKYRKEFQEYLLGLRPGGNETHHAAYGFGAAAGEYPNLEAAFGIAGHHAGLHDASDLQQMNQRYGAVDEGRRLLAVARREIPELAGLLRVQAAATDPLCQDVGIRMLFSCLVDADRLDTAAITQGSVRDAARFDPAALLDKLRAHTDGLSADRGGRLARLRALVFEAAIQRAADRPGFFSMTVPTGGGKTLSAMAFALAHARAHNLRRVIVVIPFLSIIEQNAAIYRRVLGDDVVVENHSAVRVPDEDVHDSSSERAERMALELAAENWDSPVVVTTSVQFVESLLARQPSRCRKLHNIARSVVIFDECQALPGHLLNPTLSVLRELVRTWGVSILLCSATQPGFRQSPGLVEGLAAEEIREIAPSPPNLYLELRRVRYLLPARDERLSWAALAEAVSQRPQALVVVNTRKAAFDLWQEILQRLPNEEQGSLFHLSSAMCAQHRFDFLGEACVPSASTIRGRLDARLSCRVVSTQLIEAGVDVDFPVLCRAMGPLDSLVQAAGRCNREGRLAELGEVHVFHPAETGMPRGPYCVASQVTATILDGLDPDRLATDPSLFADYFGRLYGGLLPTDHARRGERPIQDDRRDRNFRTVSEHAKAISDDMWPVVVPYGKAPELVADARARRRFGRNDLRRLQRFLVNVRNREYTQLQQMGVLHPLMDGVDLQVVDACCYNVNLGLVIRQRPLEDFVQ